MISTSSRTRAPRRAAWATHYPRRAYLSGQAQGRPIKRPSRRWLYDLARYKRTPGVLEDAGSSAYLMCAAAVEHGLIAEDRFPFDAAAINEPPPFDADVAAMDALGLDWWRAGSDPEELAAALDRGQIPCVAIPVHTNFRDWSTDSIYTDTDGEFLGFHMLCLVGFEEHPALGLIFKVLNSWGTGWGQGGFIYVTGDFLRRKAFDRLLLRTAPASR